MLEACVEGGLLAEVPGKADHLYRARLGGVEFFQVVEGGVPAAVIHKDDLVVISAAAEGGDNRVLKGFHVFRLVVARNDQ